MRSLALTDEQISKLSVPEITELIKRLAEEMELRNMQMANCYHY